MSKMSNEGQELILLLIMGLIIFKLMSTDSVYSTNGHIDSHKVNSIVQEFKYKHTDEIEEIKQFIKTIHLRIHFRIQFFIIFI